MYTFKNTEINNKKASDFETKSLLYLLSMKKHGNEIEYITVDCFNDVTASNEDFTKLWDVQSKNHKSLPPSKIGESLFTLYDNYISHIHFVEYILFIPKLERTYLIDDTLNIYKYNNINEKQKKGIEKKLKAEIVRVLKDNAETPLLFQDFLNNVIFVEDNQYISTYIKKVVQFKNKRIFSNKFYESIFEEIRNKQSVLKNSYIENKTITHPKDVLAFNRHITKKEINTFLINRFVGVDIFSNKGIPVEFLQLISHNDKETIKDLIQEYNENLSRAFFNKNDGGNFWKLSEFIILAIKKNPKNDMFMIYDIFLESSIKIKSTYLTKNTILYMIALVMEGLDNDN